MQVVWIVAGAVIAGTGFTEFWYPELLPNLFFESSAYEGIAFVLMGAAVGATAAA